MLNENIRALRKAKGMSQEEVAGKLNVVRQTVSKWEKGLSVPDSDMLVKLAELFEAPVSQLLGAKIEEPEKADAVAEQLARINEQLVIKNRRAKRVWRVMAVAAVIIVLAIIATITLGMTYSFRQEYGEIVESKEEAVYVVE